MRSLVVVGSHPLPDDLLGFLKRGELLAVEALIAETTVETFNESVLPWTARLDVRRSDFNLLQEVANSFADELGTIVAAHKCRRPSQDEEVGESVDHVGRVQLPLHCD